MRSQFTKIVIIFVIALCFSACTQMLVLPMQGVVSGIVASISSLESQGKGSVVLEAPPSSYLVLDRNLAMVAKLDVENAVIFKTEQLVQQENYIYLLTLQQLSNNDDETSVILKFNLNDSALVGRWEKKYLLSLAAVGEQIFAISHKNKLLKLEEQGVFQEQSQINIDDLVYMLPLSQSDTIFCSQSKDDNKPFAVGGCQRQGNLTWSKREGRWSEVAPPFLCGDYLIEEDMSGPSIASRHIMTGEVAAMKSFDDFKNLGCFSNRLYFSRLEKIILLNPATLDVEKKVKCGEKAIWHLAISNEKAYCLDKDRLLSSVSL